MGVAVYVNEHSLPRVPHEDKIDRQKHQRVSGHGKLEIQKVSVHIDK